MSVSRPVRTGLAVALLASAAAACGDAGGLRGAGATPTATSPARLWPQLTPASSPAWDIDEADTEVVKGVTVPGDDLRKVDPVAIVRAEIAAHPKDYRGPDAVYRDTTARMAACTGESTAGKATDGTGTGTNRYTSAGGTCPVLQPYYRDLTGDGHPDLTLGFRLLPGDAPDLTAVRVYTVDKHRLLRVMAWEDAVSAVELAGRSVIIRSPSDLADYEYRLQWTWDPEQKAMLLTHDEMLRTHHGRRSGHPSPTTTAAPGPTADPRPAPSPSVTP
ncbi:hypothetical protein [Streptomyces galbus]|uniref:Lipoprotein n=1 Tax=Streptomyces galbus TaxID=33898 RepID=A0A4U5X338_STRGB|nr:hypothetical protein [Streptomyces galbus]TKT07746.1 hypothetical protein E4U92_20020 [Streptomyces galbus]GHD40846.1 lipoprotein [Streptomyces galbus]